MILFRDMFYIGRSKDLRKRVVRHLWELKGNTHGQVGSLHSNSKLNEYQVVEIFKLTKSGISQRKIAKMFGVSRGCICGILSGKTWTHLGLRL